MKIVDLLERATKAMGFAFSLAALLALVTLNTTDEVDLRRFSIYALGQSLRDLVSLVGVWILAWLVLRSKGLRAFVKAPLQVLRTPGGGVHVRNSLATLVCLALALSVLLNAFFLVRARAYFWRFLLQKSYVEGTISRVDGLGASGRIQDAYALATEAQRVLTDEADQSRITNRVLDLAGRVESSRRLSQRYRRPDPLAWNPITQRIYYFGNAEAVRLNPQNYQAVEVLSNLHSRVLAEMRADVERLCRQGGATSLQTVSVLEAQVFAQLRSGDCKSAARAFLDGIWQPERVRSLVAQSLNMR